MRLFIITTPFTGHITPTFNMAKSLTNMRHNVDYITTSQWESAIQEIGAGLIPYEHNRKLSPMIIDAYKIALSIGSQYDGIIYDELFFPGKALGNAIGIPTVRFFPCVAINEQIMTRLIHGNGFMGIFRSSFIRKRWTKEICKGLIPNVDDWTDEVVYNAPDCNIVFVPEWFQPMLSDFPSDKFHFVGPSIYNDLKAPDWLTETKQPVIYVSLGTIDNKQLRFYKNCLQVFADKDARFVLSVGNKIPIEKLGTIPSNCTIFSYAPQKKILEHADLFITHGGMNSVNEAMINGVPMLVFPVSNDQPINAERVEELGIGKTLDIKNLDGEILWESISEILSNKIILTRAKEAEDKLYNNNGAEKAVKAIISFISTLKNDHS